MDILFKHLMALLIIVVSLFAVCHGFFSSKKIVASKAKKIIVIGSGPAGIGFIEELIDQKSPSQIIWISADKDVPYDRTKLDSILSKKRSAHKLVLFDKKVENIQLIFGKKVVKIDAEKKEVTVEDSTSYCYDYLFLATGSNPIMPTFEGYDHNKPVQGVFNFYTLDDAQNIDRYVQDYSVKKAVIFRIWYYWSRSC